MAIPVPWLKSSAQEESPQRKTQDSARSGEELLWEMAKKFYKTTPEKTQFC